MSDASRQNYLNKIRVQKDLEKATGSLIERHGRGTELISKFAGLDREDQDFIYHWADIVSQSNDELATQFVNRAPSAFGFMNQNGVEMWLLAAMDAFDKRGLGTAIEALENLTDFVASYARRHSSCTFDSVAQFLQHFIKGLGGRELQITTGAETFTDTEKLFLAERITEHGERLLNFSLYKLTAVHLWAQCWYGTWRYQVVERLLRSPNPDTTTAVFNRLECIRLDACIGRDLPGLHRQLRATGFSSDAHARQWQRWCELAPLLAEPAATAVDSLTMVAEFSSRRLPALKRYQGEIHLHRVRDAMFARVDREKAALKQVLQELQSALERSADGDEESSPNPKEMGEFSLAESGDPSIGGDLKFELRYDGEPVEMSAELEALLGSMMQDFDEVPQDHLQGLDPAMYPAGLETDVGDHLLGVNRDDDPADQIAYREWDYTRQRYREAYCLLNEYDVPTGEEGFVEETLAKYQVLLKSIKKTFAAVLGEPKLQRKQSQGDDIDIDALVEAHADFASGREMSDYVYMRYRNLERNIAVMFMVDMSGSTLGWVNDAERESLILLCEALETLGDRYAIYGFSGRTNKRCEIYRIKKFDEAYDSVVRERISGIRPKSYTRMGVAIRHLGHLLNMTRARTKILITLSDGRPEDYGGYKGRYGIEDTRHALLEIRRDGVHSFCITIDKEAQDYLPHMYGVANYAVIDEVKKLPLKVADIYRRLTT